MKLISCLRELELEIRKSYVRISTDHVAVGANKHNGCVLTPDRHIHQLLHQVGEPDFTPEAVHNYVDGPVREQHGVGLLVDFLWEN